MTKIDIISGFLGAGKTTLIQKLLKEALNGQKVVLIENEFGEIGIDGGFLKEAGVQITEMNSGCICCSLVGDFGTALKDVLNTYTPDRVIIEPSGVGKLSDVIKAVEDVAKEIEVELNSYTAVVDASKCKMYMKNFGEFFNNQVEHANTIILSRTQNMKEDKLEASVALLREHNEKAKIVTTPWDDISGDKILETMEASKSLADEMMEEHHHHHHEDGHCCEHHHHDHDHEDGHCCDHDHHHEHDHEDGHCCGHHHDHEHDHEDGHCCGHHHDHEHDHEDGHCCGHDHDHEHDHEDGHCCGHDHHHDHDHEEGHCCGHDHHDHGHHHEHDHEDGHCCGHDHHHHHHHADDVFTSWGVETPHKYEKEKVEEALKKLANTEEFGIILRAKGMIAGVDGTWIYFDLVPGEYELREGSPEYTGRLCVIGTKLEEEKLKELFEIS